MTRTRSSLDAKRARHRRAHRVRHLRRGPDREAEIGAGGAGEHPARLDGHRRHPGDTRAPPPRRRPRRRSRARDRRCSPPTRRRRCPASPRRAGGPGRERLVHGDRGGERLEVHHQRVRGVGGAVRIVGDDDGHRLARVPRLAGGERGMPVDAERRRRHERRHRVGDVGEVRRGDHGDDAGQGERGAGLDPADTRARVRAPHDGRVRHARHAEVVHELAPADDEALVLLALDGRAERRRQWARRGPWRVAHSRRSPTTVAVTSRLLQAWAMMAGHRLPVRW